MQERNPERKLIHPQLDVVVGPMFSGKTDELIRKLVRETIAKVEVQAFKPTIDVRYGTEGKLYSHSGSEFPAVLVDKTDPRSILSLVKNTTKVVGIEEAQFFNREIIDVCEELVASGKRVIIAGLQLNFRREPFGPMPELMARAQKIDLAPAVCMICGEDAFFTQRLVNSRPAYYEDPEEVVGAAELYEARCRTHHEIPHRPAPEKE
jgi:thymidine kinase